MRSTSLRVYQARISWLLTASLVALVIGAVVLKSVLVRPVNPESAVISSTDDSTAYLVPRPSSIEALLRKSNLVVIGTVGDVVQQTNEGGLRPGFTPRADDPRLPTFPFTYYSVKVERVLASADQQVVQGQDIVLRVNGGARYPEWVGGQMRMPRAGDRRLFVLSSHPEIDGYSPVPWGVFRIGDNIATYDDAQRTPVSTFTTAISSAEFVAAIRATPLGNPVPAP